MDAQTHALVQIVMPIVEGQLRSFAKAHPSVLDGVTWYRDRDRLDVFVDSAAKRISTALLCPETVARMRSIFS